MKQLSYITLNHLVYWVLSFLYPNSLGFELFYKVLQLSKVYRIKPAKNSACIRSCNFFLKHKDCALETSITRPRCMVCWMQLSTAFLCLFNSIVRIVSSNIGDYKQKTWEERCFIKLLRQILNLRL